MLVPGFLENDSGSNALPGEADPRSPASPQHPGWGSQAVRRLGSEVRAVRTVARSRHPDRKVSMDTFSEKGVLFFFFYFLEKINTFSEEEILLFLLFVLLPPLFPVHHLTAKLLTVPGFCVGLECS